MGTKVGYVGVSWVLLFPIFDWKRLSYDHARGPCLSDGGFIMVKKWTFVTFHIALERDLFSTMPIWIKIPSIRLNFGQS